MRKILGVIGGMGPEATAYFYEEVIAHTKALKDQDHIDMVILSHASMPDRTGAINSGDHEELLAAMKGEIEKLEKCGAGNIAIPCNTSHFFLDKIQAMTEIPVINMIEETAKYIAEGEIKVKKVGILATDGAVKAGLYQKACEKFGLQSEIPDPEYQQKVMSLIYDDIKAGKLGDEDKFHAAVTNLQGKGCNVIILACTELSVYKKHHKVPMHCVDALDVLVRESITRSGAEYEEL
ncbi:MAG: aspartate/glutamate racemase family protein [Lachnospiraceae bacterium]|jgi:aspartate racemase|nr:aspartate/glutamate racemase family protein [Lachnospiraceae bacterium]